ncbi:hypothetical protein KSP40_PGU005753 [Platanthera guangdongensis]|uniref:Uncharacterized protein n=1 Tax=Platanthera guangdongensis TaxID=2320717 RepID=A0ABR2LWA5_9ASPA
MWCFESDFPELGEGDFPSSVRAPTGIFPCSRRAPTHDFWRCSGDSHGQLASKLWRALGIAELSKDMHSSVIENQRLEGTLYTLLTLLQSIPYMGPLPLEVAMVMSISGVETTRKGYIRQEPDAIFIRSINEVEVKPKPKAIHAAPPHNSTFCEEKVTIS